MSRLLLPVGAAVAALLLWNTFLVFPLKIFVVFLHELSHGIAAMVTGGSIERIELSAEQGGVCVTLGGSRFLVLSAGYLGSLAFGALFLVLGSRSRKDRAILGVVGAVTGVVTLLYVRTTFGLVYGISAAAVMIGIAWKLPSWASDALLKIVGVVSCLYAVWDIGSDVLFRDIPGSDANALGEVTGIPGVLWGIVWVLASAVVVGVALWVSAKGPPDSGIEETSPAH